MDGRQRMSVALERGVPDLAPVFLRELTLPLDITGSTTPEVCAGGYDAERAARSVTALHSVLAQDAVVGGVHFIGMEVEHMGGGMCFPTMGIPSITRHPLASPEAVDGARSPDPLRDGPFPSLLRCYEQVATDCADAMAIANVEGPFMRAGYLRGLEALLMDMMEEPGLARRVLDLATDISGSLAEALLDHGAEAVFLACATDNPDIIGSTPFLRESLPRVMRLENACRMSGASFIFHPHGSFTDPGNQDLMDHVLDAGIDAVQLAEGNDLPLAKSLWGDRACIMGGLDPHVSLIAHGHDRISNDIEALLPPCMAGGGYVYMCSGSLHRGLPLEPLSHMVKEVRRLGRYPKGKA